MKKTIVIFFLIFVFISCGKAYAFMEYFPAVKAGGEYKKQKFDSAVEDYKKALNYKSNWTLRVPLQSFGWKSFSAPKPSDPAP